MVVEVFVLLLNDRFAEQGGDLGKLRFHAPLLVFCEVGMDYIPFAVGNDGGIFNAVGQGKYPIEEQEPQKKACEGDEPSFQSTP
jgi:hypothetical protein